jgi:hypothetical protein
MAAKRPEDLLCRGGMENQSSAVCNSFGPFAALRVASG